MVAIVSVVGGIGFFFIGLKYSVSQLALPIVGVGVLLKQFSKGRWAQLGLVLSGLGLIFVGIQYLQDGMADLNAYIDLTLFSDLNMVNRLILIFIGIVMTIIMQSSSAAIATTITVLSAGTIDCFYFLSLFNIRNYQISCFIELD